MFDTMSDSGVNVSEGLDTDPLLEPLRKLQRDALMLGGVLLRTKLGEGGMGSVYLGWHTRLNLPVAVKVLKEATPANLPMFLREARLTVSLDHPNLVRVFDVNFDAASGLYYIVMEYISGISAYRFLEEQLAKNGKGISEVAALEIALSAARALSAAHHAGIVHKDVKSDNVLIRRSDGAVKLTDLGFAGKYGERGLMEMKASVVAGTMGFLSPEALMGEEVTPAADVYGLGATLFELLTGAMPYGPPYDDSYYTRQFAGDAPDIRGHNPEISDHTAKLIQRCLEREPRRRFPDGETLAKAIEAVAAILATHSSKQLPAVHPPPLAEAPVVLCVDDDENVLDLLKEVLELEGFHPVCFSDAQEAVNNLERVKPDVAVVDMMMPQIDGASLCRRMRQIDGYQELGVLILSGTLQPQVIDTAMHSGVNDYLLKPVRNRELVTRLKLLAKLRHMRREKNVIETQLLKLRRSSDHLRHVG